MLTRFFEKLDDHIILYSAATGAVLNIVYGGSSKILESAAMFAVVGPLFWYMGKSVVITAGTIARWDEKIDGPMFKVGDTLTEYAETKARRTGEYAGAAMARELRRHEREKQDKL